MTVGRIKRKVSTTRGPHGDGFLIVAGIILAMFVLALIG